MYLWPNGEVTGSVQVAPYEAFIAAIAAGESLERFAEFFPPHLTLADYPQPQPEPELAKRGPGRPRKEQPPSEE